MKTYVVILSRTFPATHPRKGENTGFFYSLRNNSRKLHTIRSNYPLWKARFEKIEAGEACLSVRVWEGIAYRSKQVEIARLTAECGIGIQKIIFSRSDWEDDKGRHFCYWATVDGKEINIEDIATNDGLSDFRDFVEWFNPEIEKQNPDKDGWRHLELAIIHFTQFRY